MANNTKTENAKNNYRSPRDDLCKRETTSKELVQKNQEERRKRERVNRERAAIIRIQSIVRGFLTRRRTQVFARTWFHRLSSVLLSGQESEDVDARAWANSLRTCLRAFKFIYANCASPEDVKLISQLLLSVRGREALGNWLELGIDTILNTVSHVLEHIMTYLRLLPPASPSSRYVLPVRVLEVLLDTQCSPIFEYGSSLSMSSRSRALQHIVLHLCKHGYFHSVAVFIESQSSYAGTCADAFDQDEFCQQHKNRAMLDLLQIPFKHYSAIDPTTDSSDQQFLSAALADVFAVGPGERQPVSAPILRLIVSTIIKTIPPKLLIDQLYTSAVSDISDDDCDFSETFGSVRRKGLQPSISLLHHFVCEILPNFMGSAEVTASVLGNESYEAVASTEESGEILWANAATSASVANPVSSMTAESAAASLRIMAWLFTAMMRARCSPEYGFAPPFPPPPLQLNEDLDGVYESDDESEQGEEDDTAELSRNYSPAVNFTPVWAGQIAEVFAGLQACLPSLAFRTLRSIYTSNVLVNSDFRLTQVGVIATLYYMLAFVRGTSANSMIPLNSVLSQFPGFLRDLWGLFETMEDYFVTPGTDFRHESRKWCPKVKLFELIASGEVSCLPSKIDRYTSIVLTFVDCLRHRLLCLTDIEISEVGSSGCGFSPSDLLQIGCRLRDFMLGLISLAHPSHRPTLDEIKSSLFGASREPNLKEISSLHAALERVQKRADATIGGRFFGPVSTPLSRHSEAAVILRWELKRWSALFCHMQRLVMLIFDWDRRARRQLAPCDRDSGCRLTSVAIAEDSVWLKPDCLNVFQLDKLPRWLGRAENCAVALAKAPFGFYSWLNPDRDDDPSVDMSYWDWRQMTTLIEMPFVISFWRRVQIFQALVQANRQSVQSAVNPSLDPIYAVDEPVDRTQPVRIRVRRDYIYEDAFEKLSKENTPYLRPRLNVIFFNQANVEEMGLDGGGLSREFLTLLVKDGFNPTRGFFLYTDDNTLYPNPNASALTPDYLKHYYFLGRILGKALYEGLRVEVQFAHFFLAKLVSRTGVGLGFDYLYSLDQELYRQLCMLKKYQGNVQDLELDFSTVQTNFGEPKVVELKPGGISIPVTDATRVEYVHLVANYKLNRQIYPQSKAFIAGMTDVIYPEWLRLFDAEELQILISGADATIDVEDLRRHTIYVGGLQNPTYQQTVNDFWEILRVFPETKKRDLLRFATACSRPPVFGFRDLQPPFAVQIVSDTSRLPTSSTCMNLLKLPAYADRNILKERLLYVLDSNAGFEYS